MHNSAIITVLGALALPISAIAVVLPGGAPPQASNLQSRDAQPMFSIGGTTCHTIVPTPAERSDLFVAGGNIDVGCGEFQGAHLGIGAHLQDMSWFQHPVCGRTLNFAPKGGNFDVYEDGQFELLGTCYPHEGRTNYCPSWSGGNCEVQTKFWCKWSGKGNKPCA